MALNFPNLKAVSGNFTVATPCSLPELSQPLLGQPFDYLLKQEFMIGIKNYTPLALNTPHPDFATYFLVSPEPEKKDQSGGMVKWTRTYAQVPASYTEPGGNLNYTIIGFEGVFGIGVTDIAGRPTRPDNLECQLLHDFFLVGPMPLEYQSWEAIPMISATEYVYDYHAINPANNNDFFPTTLLTNKPPFNIATIPSRADYEAMILADAEDPTSFSLVAENSTIERWMGNIYRRTTRKVKAF